SPLGMLNKPDSGHGSVRPPPGGAFSFTRCERWFVAAAIAILWATGLAKWSWLFTHPPDPLPDPVFGFLSQRMVLAAAAGLEWLAAALAWWGLRSGAPITAAGGIAWLASVIALYRAGLWFLGETRPCACLGGGGLGVTLTRGQQEILAGVVLGGLLLGGYGMVCRRWWRERARDPRCDRCAALVVLPVGAALLSFAAPAGAVPDGFVAEGIISGRRTVQRVGEVAKEDRPLAFSAAVALSGEWLIRMNLDGASNEFHIVAFDGTNQFSVMYSDVLRHRGHRTDRRLPVERNTNIAVLDIGSYPARASYDMRTVWLGLASGRFFAERTNGCVTLPWRNERLDPRAYGFRVEGEFSDRPPGLPTAIRFVRRRALDLPDPEELKRPERGGFLMKEWKELLEQRKAWPEGWSAATFTRTRATNFHGIDLPLAWVCEVADAYALDRVSQRITVEVTNVAALPAGFHFQPPILGRVVVADGRFRFREGNRGFDEIYHTLQAPAVWPSTNDARLQEQFRTEAIGAPLLDSGGRLRRRTGVAVVLLLGAVGLGVLLHRMSRRYGKAVSDAFTAQTKRTL
ncbi:MAG TPA: hypothetical protein VNO52_16210, partial [Methylomirabilota bacterium]|nr:hypothetical protein [Methylomirabilota bacterium]